MNTTRWTLGVVLAAAVSLFGLIEADASPFSSYILSDDLGNSVRGTAPEASDWEDEAGADDGSGADDGGGNGNNGHGNNDDGVDSSNPANGNGNNGHGNNDDGVDSSNPGQGNGGPNGGVDESCPEGGECVDDESGSSSNGNGNGKGKKK